MTKTITTIKIQLSKDNRSQKPITALENTQRIRSRFVDVECPAGRAGRVRFAPTPVQNAVWSIGRRRGRRTTSICTIFLRTL